MVIDSSAVVAHLCEEGDAEVIEDRLARSEASYLSAVTALECRLVLRRRLGPAGPAKFDRLLQIARIEVVPFDADQALIAFDSYQRFGKGTGHPARLNLGDCAAYALAISRGLPLLFKGGDFDKTDVTPAL